MICYSTVPFPGYSNLHKIRIVTRQDLYDVFLNDKCIIHGIEFVNELVCRLQLFYNYRVIPEYKNTKPI